MISHDEELQILRLVLRHSKRLLRTQDELMMGPYHQLHGRIEALLGMMETSEAEIRSTEEQEL